MILTAIGETGTGHQVWQRLPETSPHPCARAPRNCDNDAENCDVLRLRGDVSVGSLKVLQAFRWVAFAEGISWIALLAGMVFKYGFDMPMAVTVTGQIHGYLVMLYLALMAVCWYQQRWSWRRGAALIFWLLIPIGGLVVARRIEREASEEAFAVA